MNSVTDSALESDRIHTRISKLKMMLAKLRPVLIFNISFKRIISEQYFHGCNIYFYGTAE
jgi:hypothetical protein